MFIFRFWGPFKFLKQIIMDIEAKYKNSLNFLNDTNKINDEILNKLLESCCKILSNEKEAYDISNILPRENYSEIKQLYASLQYIYTQFVKNCQSSEDFLNFLLTECNIERNRAKILEKYYKNSYDNIRIQLLNIGNHLPHITDVRWKIDYVIKSNALDQSEGPIFKVSLKTEKYDSSLQGPKVDLIEFSCSSQELQDLVYKLKDAVRHCQKIANGH